MSRHSPLAIRLLFPSQSSLPPLLDNKVPDEVNAELYDFIALALRAFVNPWWSKITRYDKQFLPEITRILTHVFRVLEQRLTAADLTPLIFQDIPTIVAVHYRDYRNAASKVSTSYAGSLSLPQLFHQLEPHIAISPEGVIDPEYIRQILDLILKVCLPTEDYAPESERVIVREIILKILLNDVIPKITQPWFIQKMILDQLENDKQTPQPPTPPSNTTLLSTLTNAYNEIMSTPHEEKEKEPYAQPILSMLSEIFSTNDRYASRTLFTTLEMTTSALTPFINRLFSYLLDKTFSHSLLFNIVHNAKKTLFPNGYPAPPPVDPTLEEQAEMREKLVGWRPKGGAAHVLPILLGPDPSSTIEGAIDPLSNQACNVHLVLMILDRVLLGLFPELGVVE